MNFYKKYRDNKSQYNHIQIQTGGSHIKNTEGDKNNKNIEDNKDIKDIDNILKKYFESYSAQYYVPQQEVTAVVVDIQCAINKELYTEFRIYPGSEILIEDFYEYKTINGENILKNIIKIAKELKINEINLFDYSFMYIGENQDINCQIDLAYFHILIKGHTLCNEYGFVYDDYNSDKKKHNSIINDEFDRFMDRVFAEGKKNKLKKLNDKINKINVLIQEKKIEPDKTKIEHLDRYIKLYLKDHNNIDDFKEKKTAAIKHKFSKNAKNSLLKELKILVPNYQTIGSVKDVMNYINNNYIKNGEITHCSSKARTIIKIVLYAKTILKYERILTLKL